MREASLRRVLAVLRARWLLVAALGVPVLATTWGYAATLSPAHTATAVISFAPTQGEDAGPSFLRLIPRYEIAATTQEALAGAERDAGLPSGSLDDAVSTDLPGDSLELTLSVTTPTEETSAAAVRSLTDIVSSTADDDPLVSVWPAREPETSGNETPRRQAIALVAGLLLAPVPGAVLALGLEGSRPRVRLSEDLSAVGAPVLQALPLRRRLPAGGVGVEHVLAGLGQELPRPVGGLHARGRTLDSAPDVVAISIGGQEGDADCAVQYLSQVDESVQRDLDHGRAPITFRAAPSLPAASGAEPAGGAFAHEQLCVLVVRTGLPQDEVHATAELLRVQGARILGSVLLTR